MIDDPGKCKFFVKERAHQRKLAVTADVTEMRCAAMCVIFPRNRGHIRGQDGGENARRRKS